MILARSLGKTYPLIYDLPVYAYDVSRNFSRTSARFGSGFSITVCPYLSKTLQRFACRKNIPGNLRTGSAVVVSFVRIRVLPSPYSLPYSWTGSAATSALPTTLPTISMCADTPRPRTGFSHARLVQIQHVRFSSSWALFVVFPADHRIQCIASLRRLVFSDPRWLTEGQLHTWVQVLSDGLKKNG